MQVTIKHRYARTLPDKVIIVAAVVEKKEFAQEEQVHDGDEAQVHRGGPFHRAHSLHENRQQCIRKEKAKVYGRDDEADDEAHDAVVQQRHKDRLDVAQERQLGAEQVQPRKIKLFVNWIVPRRDAPQRRVRVLQSPQASEEGPQRHHSDAPRRVVDDHVICRRRNAKPPADRTPLWNAGLIGNTPGPRLSRGHGPKVAELVEWDPPSYLGLTTELNNCETPDVRGSGCVG